MIQRIQTVYLLIAAILLALMFFLPLGHVAAAGAPARLMLLGDDSTLAAIAAGVLAGTVALDLVAIFGYRNRKRQKRLCHVLIVLLVVYAGLWTARVVPLAQAAPGWSLSVAAVFPLVAIVLVWLARRGIVRDDKLVRSLDRIR